MFVKFPIISGITSPNHSSTSSDDIDISVTRLCAYLNEENHSTDVTPISSADSHRKHNVDKCNYFNYHLVTISISISALSLTRKIQRSSYSDHSSGENLQYHHNCSENIMDGDHRRPPPKGIARIN